jgi:hypothetical protein
MVALTVGLFLACRITANIERPSQRQTLPVTSCNGCSFQFGRTSMWQPRAPHLAHRPLWGYDHFDRMGVIYFSGGIPPQRSPRFRNKSV